MSNLYTLVKTARQFRQEMTYSEKLMWNALRKHKQNGLKFRREHYIIGFIVDFYCAEFKLIIEIDGEIHDEHDVKIRDLTRQNALEAAGFKLIRFQAKDVEINIDGVLSSIMTECGKEPLTKYPVVPTYKTSP
jgi:very-short-patch-repair endonuclease